MGRKPDYLGQIDKLKKEITRLKAIINRNDKTHKQDFTKWTSTLEKEKVKAYQLGAQDTLLAIEHEETAYMEFMRKAQKQFEKLYRNKLKTKRKTR